LHGTFKPERQTESSDGEMSGEKLGTLLRQVSKNSTSEIDSLIVELKTLHKKLQTDGDRIQRDIAEHAELSQQVMQLTKIISDSVKKLPDEPRRVPRK
jgi:methyl-accepting chemotaxis protein